MCPVWEFWLKQRCLCLGKVTVLITVPRDNKPSWPCSSHFSGWRTKGSVYYLKDSRNLGMHSFLVLQPCVCTPYIVALINYRFIASPTKHIKWFISNTPTCIVHRKAHSAYMLIATATQTPVVLKRESRGIVWSAKLQKCLEMDCFLVCFAPVSATVG